MTKRREARDVGHCNSSITEGVLKVGDGRGFVAECGAGHIVVTAAHCLPYLPPPSRGSYCEERTYKDLVGSLDGSKPTVWAECLFVDPVADVAILGEPDGQIEDYAQAEAYINLMDDSLALQIGEPPKSGRAWMLGVDGNWYSCPMEWAIPHSLVIEGETKPGMSGSPIISDGGTAIALVSRGVEIVDVSGVRRTEKSSQPVLSYTLPRWSLMALQQKVLQGVTNGQG